MRCQTLITLKFLLEQGENKTSIFFRCENQAEVKYRQPVLVMDGWGAKVELTTKKFGNDTVFFTYRIYPFSLNVN